MFFFEKKNQKTFPPIVRSLALPPGSYSDRKWKKFFGSFFQKRISSLLPPRNSTPKRSWTWLAIPAAILLSVTLLKDLRGLDPTIVPYLRVFGAFWESGRAATHGLDPFAVYPLTPPAAYPGVFDVNLSPPALLPFFALLSRFAPATLAGPWIVLQAVAFVAGAAVLLATRRGDVPAWLPFWLVLSPQLSDSVYLGQDYGVLYLLAVMGWVWMRSGRDMLAGVAIGLFVAFKPNFALWPAFLVLLGAWRPACVAALCAACASLLPIALYGPAIYPQWLAAAAADGHWHFVSESSVHGFCARLGAPGLGRLVSVTLVVASIVWVWRQRPSPIAATTLALAVGVLAAPVGWVDYIVFLFPALSDGFLGPWGAAAILLSGGGAALSPWSGALAGVGYVLAFVAVIIGVVRARGEWRGE